MPSPKRAATVEQPGNWLGFAIVEATHFAKGLQFFLDQILANGQIGMGQVLGQMVGVPPRGGIEQGLLRGCSTQPNPPPQQGGSQPRQILGQPLHGLGGGALLCQQLDPARVEQMGLNRLLGQGSQSAGGQAIPQKQQAQHRIHLHQLRL
jgi:hypothetical protein